MGEKVHHGFRVPLTELAIITRDKGSLVLQKGRPISARAN